MADPPPFHAQSRGLARLTPRVLAADHRGALAMARHHLGRHPGQEHQEGRPGQELRRQHEGGGRQPEAEGSEQEGERQDQQGRPCRSGRPGWCEGCAGRAQGPQGPQGPQGRDTGSATYVGPNLEPHRPQRHRQRRTCALARRWTGPADLEAPEGHRQPRHPRPEATNDKTAFGNQVDFVGNPAGAASPRLSYSSYNTRSRRAAARAQRGVRGQPRTCPGSPAGLQAHATLVYVRRGRAARLVANRTLPGCAVGTSTGDTGTSTGCNDVTYCTLAEAKAETGADASLPTVQITMGSGQEGFSGAVDALQINNALYDFEPFGVSQTTP